MAILQIELDDALLREAEEVLCGLGMDVPLAVSIFLRRVALERGLPLSMHAPKPVPAPRPELRPLSGVRSNARITRAMVDAVWESFLALRRGQGTLKSQSDDVAAATGMTPGSAHIYLNVLVTLAEGRMVTRSIKPDDLAYLLGRFRAECDGETCDAVRQALEQSLPYWRAHIPGSFADRVEAMLRAF